jgi:hypothetical protein
VICKQKSFVSYPSWLQSVLESIGAAGLEKTCIAEKIGHLTLMAHINTSRRTKELPSGVGTFNEALQRTSR